METPIPGGRDAPMRIAVTIGDPAGIGPEIVAKALSQVGDAAVCLYGDIGAVERAGGLPPGVAAVDTASATVPPGAPDPAAAPGVVEAIRRAVRACLAGEADAVVTAPIAKDVLARAGFAWPGHTELLAELAPPRAGGREVMLLVGGQLRVALATIHCPLREVPERLSVEGIETVLRVLDGDLRARFALPAPRIAVAGLNPHAGESGRFGAEEERVIAPAVAAARASDIAASGPFAADSLFHRAVAGEFDAVLAMYHDQGLGPLKVHAFGRAVNVTLGLPIIRTSVDHGTAFDIAGQGSADCGSLVAALRLAQELVRNERAAGAERQTGGNRT